LASVVGLDFVGDRLHVALVDGSSGSANVRTAFTAALPKPLSPANAAELGAWLKDQLAQQKIGANDAAVSLGRGHSSFRTLQVPECPPEELPGLVQLTLEGEIGGEGDQVVDFDAGPIEGGQRTVTAAYAPSATVEAVREVLKVAGLSAKRVVLRPYAMRFLREQMLGAGDGGTELLLIPTGDGLDLSIWSGKRLEMARSVATGGNGDASAKLSAELRRTLAAYQNNKPGATLHAVAALAGNVDAYAPSVENALQRSISSADPAKKLHNLPESKAVWGAVATAWQTAAAAPPTLNLFHPRRPPPPKYPPRRVAMLVGAFLIVLFGSLYFWRAQKIKVLDEEIASLQGEQTDLDKEIKENKPIENRSTEVKKWVTGRVDWLDLFNDVAAMTPATDKAIVTMLHGDAAAQDLRGRLKVDLRARDSSFVLNSMYALQTRYAVQAKGLKPNNEHSDFQNNEAFEIAFLPKGVKETNGKSNGKKASKTPVKEQPTTPVVAVADTVPTGKQRVPTGFGMKKQTAVASTTRTPGPTRSPTSTNFSPSSTTTSSSGSGEAATVSAFESDIARLAKLPLDEFERELAKKPRLLQNRFRKAVEEAKAKK